VHWITGNRKKIKKSADFGAFSRFDSLRRMGRSGRKLLLDKAVMGERCGPWQVGLVRIQANLSRVLVRLKANSLHKWLVPEGRILPCLFADRQTFLAGLVRL
jgi:hypothetical protein